MNQLSEISADTKKQLSFTCTFEKDHVPQRDPEADLLYRHARWLRKNNILKKDPAVFPAMERLLRIAAAYGHDKANVELRDMLDKGQAISSDPANETIDLVQDLIERRIPAGYYDMGWYLEHGYGVHTDRDLSFKYYRKSADLGNPEGQYLVGGLLANLPKNGAEVFQIGLEMFRCAALQGHAESARTIGSHLQIEQKFARAAEFFQIGAQYGNAVAASMLANSFGPGGNDDELYRLEHEQDPGRQQRYKQIADFISAYQYLSPSVPEIEKIVPLPPTSLPDWDGKFQWLEAHKANVPPPLPSEERIAEMARTKGLDQTTGRPASPR